MRFLGTSKESVRLVGLSVDRSINQDTFGHHGHLHHACNADKDRSVWFIVTRCRVFRTRSTRPPRKQRARVSSRVDRSRATNRVVQHADDRNFLPTPSPLRPPVDSSRARPSYRAPRSDVIRSRPDHACARITRGFRVSTYALYTVL